MARIGVIAEKLLRIFRIDKNRKGEHYAPPLRYFAFLPRGFYKRPQARTA
jgi:hypothetical protein